MPINVYTGLMRSGKSYEVVSMVILPAILAGRDVVTNVDGISEELIWGYLKKRHSSADSSKFGRVRHVTNEDVFKPDFLPFYDDAKDAHTDTVVKPGDLVCIDEAWRFWGTDCKLHKNHKSFMLEHGHFVHPISGVACDLVCMIQDMGTLHRFVRSVVAFSYRTHKKVSLGMSNTYSVTMWEGSKLTKSQITGNWVRRYDKSIFPLYSSFKGGADGKLTNVDKRQNIFSNSMLWFKVGGFLLMGIFSMFYVWRFFNPPVKDAPKGSVSARSVAATSIPNSGSVPASGSVGVEPISSWRIAGKYVAHGQTVVVLVDGPRLRLESPSNFAHDGMERVGHVDGQFVSTYSGAFGSQAVKGASQ